MATTRIVEFDAAELPFHDLSLGVLKDFVAQRYGARLERVQDLHQFVPQADVAALYDAFYRFVGGEAFKTAYAKLGRFVVDTQFGGRAAVQRIPSIRIHLVHQKSVQFHTDEWYGHGREVTTCWLPLVDVAGNNSMFVVEPEDSEALARVFERERATVREMNERMRARSRPLVMRFGQIFMFNSRVMHGSELNDTESSRLSFDFRILPDGADRGVKSETFFAPPDELAPSPPEAARGDARRKVGIVYVNLNDGFTRFISQKNQQLLSYKYAADYDISVLTAETEIVTMSHYPMLFDLLAGEPGRECDVLILFSVLLLPQSERDQRRVFQMARERGLELRFVTEDVTFPARGSEADERRILALRGQMLARAA